MSGVSYSAGAVVGGGFLRCRGCGGRGLWVLFPSSLLLLPVFSSRGRRVLSSYTPLGSIGLTPGSIGLTLVLSGSTPGVLGDQSKNFLVRGRGWGTVASLQTSRCVGAGRVGVTSVLLL